MSDVPEYDAILLHMDRGPCLTLLNARLADGASGSGDPVKVDNAQGFVAKVHAHHRGANDDPSLSVEIEKSTNGGDTWSSTGLSWTFSLAEDEPDTMTGSIDDTGPLYRATYSADDEWSVSVAICPVASLDDN